MNDKLRSFMIKQSPKLMKTVIDKANHGGLPDTLTVGEISSLWSRDGLANGSPEWKEATVFLLDLIMRKKLFCENMDVALGNPDPQKVQYERIASGLGYDSSVSGNTNYSPINALVKKESLQHFLCENGGKSIVDSLLINKWLPVDNEPDEDNSRINPKHKEGKASAKKDELAWQLVDTHPTLSTYLQCRTEFLTTKEKAYVKNELIKHNSSFCSGFAGWWKSQNIFKKGIGGPG